MGNPNWGSLYYNKAIVERIIDGDSIVVSKFKVSFGLTYAGVKAKGIHLRLNGLNTPEKTGDEKLLGYQCKEYLETLLTPGDEILVRTLDVDSFGRWLSNIWIPHQGDFLNLNEHLIDGGWAISWDGESAKPSFNINEQYPIRKL